MSTPNAGPRQRTTQVRLAENRRRDKRLCAIATRLAASAQYAPNQAGRRCISEHDPSLFKAAKAAQVGAQSVGRAQVESDIR